MGVFPAKIFEGTAVDTTTHGSSSTTQQNDAVTCSSTLDSGTLDSGNLDSGALASGAAVSSNNDCGGFSAQLIGGGAAYT